MVEDPYAGPLDPRPHPAHVFGALHARTVLRTGDRVDRERVAPFGTEAFHVRERLRENPIHPMVVREMAAECFPARLGRASLLRIGRHVPDPGARWRRRATGP